MDQIAMGAMAMGYAVAGLFFLRFWKDTGDRLFGLFALAFFVLVLNRIGSAIFGTEEGYQGNHVYWIRLAAFALILVAIVDKNRFRRVPRSWSRFRSSERFRYWQPAAAVGRDWRNPRAVAARLPPRPV